MKMKKRTGQKRKKKSQKKKNHKEMNKWLEIEEDLVTDL